jgi:hypothetical protein
MKKPSRPSMRQRFGHGDWIPGLIDPAANGRNQVDGYQLIQMYRNLGLALESLHGYSPVRRAA